MRRAVPRALLPAVLLASASLAACSSAGAGVTRGACTPTVEGAAVAGFRDAATARQAFARGDKDGTFFAVLEDVAWLRFEGDEEAVMKKHRAYFEQGYTTFEVTLLTKDFTQPTGESFVLTDSNGAHLIGRPVGYQGSMGMENERFASRFQVSFRHAITREVGWVKLQRVSSGAELEWTFPWAAATTPSAGVAPASGPAAYAPRVEAPENLVRARNPAPAPALAQGGKPVNLLAPPTGSSAPHAPVPSSAAVGEPAWSEPPPSTFGPSSAGASAFPAPAAPPPSVTPPPAAAPAPGALPIRPGSLPAPTVRGR